MIWIWFSSENLFKNSFLLALKIIYRFLLTSYFIVSKFSNLMLWSKKTVSPTDVVGGLCMHECIHMYLHTYVYMYIHTCVHAYVHVYVHAYVHAYVHEYVNAYVHAYGHAYVRMYRRTCVHAYIRTYVRTCICTYVRMYIHTYVCMYMHVCTFVCGDRLRIPVGAVNFDIANLYIKSALR